MIEKAIKSVTWRGKQGLIGWLFKRVVSEYHGSWSRDLGLGEKKKRLGAAELGSRKPRARFTR